MTPGPSDLRFTIDHMLIKLGKYLRILGYDAAWDTRLRTHELIARANAEGRVFVTRNTRLASQYPPPHRLVTIESADPVAQMDALVSALNLDVAAGLFTKCVRCNVALDAVADKKTIQSRVHPNTFAAFDKFYTCPSCGTVFWKGSHVRNTCRKLRIPLRAT